MAYHVVFENDHTLAIDTEDLDRQDFVVINNHQVSILQEARNYKVELIDFDLENKVMTLLLNGKSVEVRLHDEVDQMVHDLGMELDVESITGDIVAPMPGKVLEVAISPGMVVHEGDPLIVLEAMKMENILKATGTGTIKEIKVDPGQTVEKSQLLITIE